MQREYVNQSGAVVLGPYRYLLWRAWNPRLPHLLWILLNPSTADERVDDPTLRRIHSFSQHFGFGGLEVVNLFALRSTDPRKLVSMVDPVGPENDSYIGEALVRATKIIAAWGSYGTLYGRGQSILAKISSPIFCLGTTRNGNPRHPLYLRGDTTLCAFPIDR